MRFLRYRPALTAAALVWAVALGACGSTGNDRNDSAIEPTAPGTTALPTSTTSAPATTSTPPSTTTSAAPSTTASPPPTLAPGDIRLGLVEVAKVDEPTALAARPGDNTLFVTAQRGIVYALRPGANPVEVIDLADTVESGGEQGLLGIAFSNDGATVFLDYTLADGSAQVDAYTVRADGTFDAASRRKIINIPHPDQANHNGGNLLVDSTGALWISTGDGGGAGDPFRRAQDLLSLLGKILRIMPNPTGDGYTIPDDNPFAGMSSKVNEIWAYGLRNPWRFSLDRLTGDLWVGDVGQSKTEEVNFVRATDGAGRGANFGWSAFEGTKRFNKDVPAPSDHVTPVYSYPHNGKSASITGGYVYRGTDIPGLYGAYVFGDNVMGTVWALRLDDAGKPTVATVGFVESVSAFGEDNEGELYALSYSAGTVYRIVGA